MVWKAASAPKNGRPGRETQHWQDTSRSSSNTGPALAAHRPGQAFLKATGLPKGFSNPSGEGIRHSLTPTCMLIRSNRIHTVRANFNAGLLKKQTGQIRNSQSHRACFPATGRGCPCTAGQWRQYLFLIPAKPSVLREIKHNRQTGRQSKTKK